MVSMLVSFLIGLTTCWESRDLFIFRKKPPKHLPYYNPEQFAQDEHPEKAKDDRCEAEADPQHRVKPQLPPKDHEKTGKEKKDQEESPGHFLEVIRQRTSQHPHPFSPSVPYYHTSSPEESPLPGTVKFSTGAMRNRGKGGMSFIGMVLRLDWHSFSILNRADGWFMDLAFWEQQAMQQF
jgi:hypothetical protein